MAWHLAPSLVNFRNEVNKKWPNRPKGSDGTIGDAAHAARQSDHNPNSRGSVNAIDITYPGVDPKQIIAAVSKHPSAHYVIFNRKIYTREGGWKAEPYSGISPHTEHLHISILQTVAAEQNQVKWFRTTTSTPAVAPVLTPPPAFPLPSTHAFGASASTTVHNGKASAKDAEGVKKIQAKFKDLPVTGFYGPQTTAKVRAWQIRRLMPPTGRVGRREWNRLFK